MTLDADTEVRLKQRMAERGISFKQALNEAVRVGLGLGSTTFVTAPVSMGVPTVNLDRALQLVGELEDDELIQRMRRGG